jgi:hypothetical protein
MGTLTSQRQFQTRAMTRRPAQDCARFLPQAQVDRVVPNAMTRARAIGLGQIESTVGLPDNSALACFEELDDLGDVFALR